MKNLTKKQPGEGPIRSQKESSQGRVSELTPQRKVANPREKHEAGKKEYGQATYKQVGMLWNAVIELELQEETAATRGGSQRE